MDKHFLCLQSTPICLKSDKFNLEITRSRISLRTIVMRADLQVRIPKSLCFRDHTARQTETRWRSFSNKSRRAMQVAKLQSKICNKKAMLGWRWSQTNQLLIGNCRSSPAKENKGKSLLHLQLISIKRLEQVSAQTLCRLTFQKSNN